MSSTDELVARISKRHVVIEGQPGKPSKTVSVPDFISGLTLAQAGQVEEREELGQTIANPFLLPPNVYAIAQSKNQLQVGLYYKERIIPEVYWRTTSTKIKDVIFPNVVFGICLAKTSDPKDKAIKYRFNSWRVFATDRHPLSLPPHILQRANSKEHIWTLPMPNVFDDANVCTGGNSFFTTFTHDLRTLGYFYKLLTDTAFNDDLSVRSIRDDYGGGKGWLESLSGLSRFPYNRLVNFNADLHKKHMDEYTSNESR